jgi:hypothetical protein
VTHYLTKLLARMHATSEPRVYLWYQDGKPTHLTMQECQEDMERIALERALHSLKPSRHNVVRS